MRYVLIVLFVFIKCSFSYSQLGWEPWEVIYGDSTTTVEVQFRLSDNSCELDGKKFKFRTRIKGELKSYSYFVNWKMNYTDCNGGEFYQQNSISIWKPGGGVSNEIPIESIDDIFTARSLDSMHYDVEAGYYPKSGTGRRGLFKSQAPKGIVGKNRMNYGESIILTVNGGILGEGAEWIWYKDTCGTNRQGTGTSIKVQPDTTTTYFVRAEGRDNITICTQLTVNVNPNSMAPTAILLKSPPCRGVPNTLKVSGGYLGLEAVWKWYEDSCNGNFIGTGNYITINPTQPTTYFVRAEGKTNSTECAKLLVEPLNKSLDPKYSITTQKDTVCQGDSVELSIPDKGLSSDAHWTWSKDFCGEAPFATGPVIKVRADSNTIYFVRGEGQCNTTNCVSIAIAVNKQSVSADKIISIPDSAKIIKRKNTVLTLSGGELGKDAEWTWYKGSCKGKFVGKGDSITIRPRKEVSYYVKAEGLCNTTDCKSILISPVRFHYFSKHYSKKLRNAYHLGLGIGLENYEFSRFMPYTRKDSAGTLLDSTFANNFVNASGIKGDFSYHPIFNRYMSLGFFTSYARGTTTLFVLGNRSSDLISDTEVEYEYKKVNLGTDIAFGFRKLKALMVFNRSTQTNDYRKVVTSDNFVKVYTFNEKFNKETVSMGLRFGSYAGNRSGRRPRTFDVLYNFTRNIPDDFFRYSLKEYKSLNDWNVGLGLNFWVQSKVNMRLDVYSNTTNRDVKTIKPNGLSYLASLTFNIDRFRNYKKK